MRSSMLQANQALRTVRQGIEASKHCLKRGCKTTQPCRGQSSKGDSGLESFIELHYMFLEDGEAADLSSLSSLSSLADYFSFFSLLHVRAVHVPGQGKSRA